MDLVVKIFGPRKGELSTEANPPVQFPARFFHRDTSRSPACRAIDSTLPLCLFSRRGSRGRLLHFPGPPAVGSVTHGRLRRAPDHKGEWIASKSFPLRGRRA